MTFADPLSFQLRECWFVFPNCREEIDKSGIYEWKIVGHGIYVGKSTKISRRMREYPNNIRKLATNSPYRKNNPDGFRAIHRALYKAYCENRLVEFKVLENCDRILLNERERFWIYKRTAEAASEGFELLNSV